MSALPCVMLAAAATAAFSIGLSMKLQPEFGFDYHLEALGMYFPPIFLPLSLGMGVARATRRPAVHP